MTVPNKAPEDMTDEELDAVLSGEPIEGEVPEEVPEPKPEETETPKETEEKPKDEEEKPKEDEEEETPKPKEDEEEKPVVSHRQERRISQLIEKLKKSGVETEEPAPKKTEKKPEGIKYDEELDADEETITRLNDDREKYAEQRYQEGLRQAEAMQVRQDAFEFRSMLQTEEPRVLQKYPFMDKDSAEFDEENTAEMVAEYMDFVGFDEETKTAKRPISYFDYVDTRMEQAQRLAERMVRETHDNVVKQAANTGLRPSGSSPSKQLNLNKAPEDMTDEELDAAIALTIPRK